MAFFNFKYSQTIEPISHHCLKNTSTYLTFHQNLLLHKGFPMIDNQMAKFEIKIGLGLPFWSLTKIRLSIWSQGNYFSSSCHIWLNVICLIYLVLNQVICKLGHWIGLLTIKMSIGHGRCVHLKQIDAEASDACSFIKAQLYMCVWALEKSGLTNPKGKSNGFQKRSLRRRFSVNMAWMPCQIWISFALKLLLFEGPNKCNTF